jgi:hypothetical protein
MAATTVGWVGTGRMGAAMVRCLVHADRDVELAVWNRTRVKAEALGERVVERVSDLADSEVVLTTVSGSADLALVITGPDGLLSRPDAAPGVIVDCSTVSAEAEALRPRLDRAGPRPGDLRFLKLGGPGDLGAGGSGILRSPGLGRARSGERPPGDGQAAVARTLPAAAVWAAMPCRT